MQAIKIWLYYFIWFKKPVFNISVVQYSISERSGPSWRIACHNGSQRCRKNFPFKRAYIPKHSETPCFRGSVHEWSASYFRYAYFSFRICSTRRSVHWYAYREGALDFSGACENASPFNIQAKDGSGWRSYSRGKVKLLNKYIDQIFLNSKR